MVLERLLVLTRYASVVCVCVCDGGKEVVTHSVYMFGPIPLSALGWRNLGLGFSNGFCAYDRDWRAACMI